MFAEKISIIIPAYNCEKTIGRCLQAALTAAGNFRNTPSLRANGRQVEIIVVDDGSTDGTKSEVLKYPTVKYFYQDNSGPAGARNRGAAEAAGDILFFTDSDCLPGGDWLELMVPHFYKPGVAAVAGSYGIANPEKRLSRCIHGEILFRHKMMPEYPRYFGSFNFAVLKSVFTDVGGFDRGYRTASGEDNDLSYKISSDNRKIYFARDALVAHYHTASLGKYLSEQYRHGFWRVRMYRDHPQMTGGDGYTFWKDIAETGLVMGIYVSVALIFLGFFDFAVWGVLLPLAALFGINLYYGRQFAGNNSDGFYFCDVMILRAFSRTNGFLSGLAEHINFIHKIRSKSK